MADPLQALAAVRALASARRQWTVLIDGRSGAGKTTLAAALASATGARLLRLDDLYPGWDGLARAAESVRREVLAPRRTGRAGSWRRWDWAVGAAAERHVVSAGGGLVCEGSGLLTRRSAPLGDLTIWVRLDDDERRRRALLRDGATYAPHWDRWAAQERAAIDAEHPDRLADLVVDGLAVQRLLSGRTARTAYRRSP